MKPALIKAEDTDWVKAGDVIICTKWCDLVTESVPYLVLLEFRQSEPPELSNGLIIDVVDDNSSDKDGNDYSAYTVPFKVLRVAYKGRQTYLKKAYVSLEQKQEVIAKLQRLRPECNNCPHKLCSGWNKVGYITKELTSELQPLIDNGNIKVNVTHICFRANYLQVGFYFTLNISRTGQWSKKVFKAAKKAK